MPADAYPDSSFLVSLYRRDTNHEVACAFLARYRLSLAFTPMHRVEVRNAFRNGTALGEMLEEECRQAFRQIEDDLQEETLVHTPVRWTEVFRLADELSAQHATAAGQRTLDLLHVAMAIECDAHTFLSFDQRQLRLARAAGLKVKP